MMIDVRHNIYRAARLPGVRAILEAQRTGPIALFYHGVEDRIVDSRVQSLHHRLDQFEEQILFLRKHFDIISLDYFFECLSNGYKMDPSQVMITFDDGYKNNLRTVAPFLGAYDVPFTVFVSTKHISDGIRFPTYYLRTGIYYSRDKYARILDDEFDIQTEAQKQSAIDAISSRLKGSRQAVANQIVEDLIALLPQDQWLDLDDRFASDQPMNWSEVMQLSDRNVIIGSHCHDHFILHENQCMEEIGAQLLSSKSLIQEHVGECKYIAYPNGGAKDIFSDALTSVRESQYSAGFTTIAGEIDSETNAYILPRIAAKMTDIRHFEFTINSCFRNNKSYREFARNLT